MGVMDWGGTAYVSAGAQCAPLQSGYWGILVDGTPGSLCPMEGVLRYLGSDFSRIEQKKPAPTGAGPFSYDSTTIS